MVNMRAKPTTSKISTTEELSLDEMTGCTENLYIVDSKIEDAISNEETVVEAIINEHTQFAEQLKRYDNLLLYLEKEHKDRIKSLGFKYADVTKKVQDKRQILIQSNKRLAAAFEALTEVKV